MDKNLFTLTDDEHVCKTTTRKNYPCSGFLLSKEESSDFGLMVMMDMCS